jgi:hypothetical protein
MSQVGSSQFENWSTSTSLAPGRITRAISRVVSLRAGDGDHRGRRVDAREHRVLSYASGEQAKQWCTRPRHPLS